MKKTNKINNDDNNNLLKIMKLNIAYPDVDDDDFQKKIYEKREYYYNKVPLRKAMTDYQDIKVYRDKECGGEKIQLHTQQSLLSNFINPETPYTGLLVFHGVGTGKTCGAFAIAENFKDMVKKYNTKIHILISGPLIKEQWKNELVEKCARDTYLKDLNQNSGYLDEVEKNKAIKLAKNQAMQYYKIMSYRSFQKKVLGQKIIEKKEGNVKSKKVYRKTSEGELDRELAIDKIDNLNNTLLIIDEAHNLTENEYGESVKKIIQNSKNLRVLLLTATPMKNLGDSIVELINLLRPANSQIERDKIFLGNGYAMEFKPGGKEYLKKMVNGYISHFRGADPLTFAEHVEHGEVPPSLIFTKVIRSDMDKFQQEAYNKVLEFTADALDRRSQSVANFVFPYYNNNSIEACSGEEGINNLINSLKANKKIVLDKINDYFFGGKENPNELITYNEKKKTIGGKIFKLEYLNRFSTKFYKCLNTINDTVEGEGKRGAGIIFVYSNLVKMGIELFREVLLQNGYLEFMETKNYNIQDDTIDSITGLTYKEFKDSNRNFQDFHPATFVTFTGKNDDNLEDVPETRINILKNHLNVINNKDGKYIKIILGSKVMNEGITLFNVKDVHILDVYYNYGRVHQVIGRAIRRCVHYKITNDQNPFPKVNVYKYVVSLPDKNSLSAEEELYKKAEYKYILVKDIERVLKETAIDCPLNYFGNMFPEEIEEYKDCLEPMEYSKLSNEERKTKLLCPANCDFQKCSYKCYNKSLNDEYYDEDKKAYKKIGKNDLDYNTFTTVLKRNEINYIKDKVKDLFKFKYVYLLDEIEEKIKNSYSGEKAELFEPYFVFQALNELIPVDENDFNNFQDMIYDKYNIPGYLIYRKNYYIFQPLNQNEDVPMWYRSNYQSELQNNLTVYNYIKNSDIFLKNVNNVKNTDDVDDTKNQIKEKISKKINYDFSNIGYYDSKEEFIYVGIIDKGSTRIKSISENTNDIFKIRPRREKILTKKRGTGIPSLKGATCDTSKDKNLLFQMAKKIGIENLDTYRNNTRNDICNMIKHRLLFLEKFSTDKNKNKYVYMIIPTNHPTYKFPLNLEDRIKYIIEKLQAKIPISLTYDFKNIGNGIFEGMRKSSFAKYELYITNMKDDIKEYTNIFKQNNFNLVDNVWTTIIE